MLRALLWCLLAWSLHLPLTPVALASDPHGAEAGGGDKKKKQQTFTMTGIENCKVPASHHKAAPICGSPHYEAYIKDVEAYNGCVDPFKSKQLLSLRPCRPKPKPAKSAGKMADKLLDVP